MKISLVMLGAVLWLSTAVLVYCQGPNKRAPIPMFEDYPITSIFRGEPALPIFAKGQGGFSTQIKEGARKGPNFAGHFTIAQWGCGSGCISFAIVDAVSGQLNYPIPFVGLGIPYMGTATGRDYKGLEYRLDSSLLIADGCPEDEDSTDADFEMNCGTRYYKWEANRFVLIQTVAVSPAPRKK
jgi:hypothetical protein